MYLALVDPNSCTVRHNFGFRQRSRTEDGVEGALATSDESRIYDHLSAINDRATDDFKGRVSRLFNEGVNLRGDSIARKVRETLQEACPVFQGARGQLPSGLSFSVDVVGAKVDDPVSINLEENQWGLTIESKFDDPPLDRSEIGIVPITSIKLEWCKNKASPSMYLVKASVIGSDTGQTPDDSSWVSVASARNNGVDRSSVESRWGPWTAGYPAPHLSDI